MENNIHINFREDTLTIIVENGGTLHLVNLPEEEKRFLENYFYLLRTASPGNIGETESLIKAMMTHIGGMMKG